MMNIVSAGIQTGNTTVATYVVDCYPQHALNVITFYSVLMNLSTCIDFVGSPVFFELCDFASCGFDFELIEYAVLRERMDQ